MKATRKCSTLDFLAAVGWASSGFPALFLVSFLFLPKNWAMGNETNDVFVTLEILLDYKKPAPYCDVEKKINVQRSQFPKLMFV